MSAALRDTAANIERAEKARAAVKATRQALQSGKYGDAIKDAMNRFPNIRARLAD